MYSCERKKTYNRYIHLRCVKSRKENIKKYINLFLFTFSTIKQLILLISFFILLLSLFFLHQTHIRERRERNKNIMNTLI